MSNSTSSSTSSGGDDWLDTGDNAWQLTAATFVGLQSVPGLVVLYAGIVKKKWAINSAFMAFYAFSAVMICWVLWAYNMSFGTQACPFLGKPYPVMIISQELKQSHIPAGHIFADFPEATMVYFQFVFAAITLVILAGALLGRMNFYAWMAFVPIWLTLSYCVGAFSLWGGGFLFQWGVIDYSGGYVIHLSSGTAGFVAAWMIGPRHAMDRDNFEPNNILLVLVGAGILWLGWNGFNGGDPYAANADAGVAVLNTNITTAMSVLTWTFLDIAFFGKPSVIGAVQGMITGLVAITPAAGVIAGWGAIVMGIMSGSLPWITMHTLRKTWFFRQVDDCLEVFHTHAVAGFMGGIMTGVLATKEGCKAFACIDVGGGAAGNGRQIGLQIVGGIFIILLNAIITPIILFGISFFIPLRMTEEQLQVGDVAVHGEDPYCFSDPKASEIEFHQVAAGAKGDAVSVQPQQVISEC